MLPTRSRRYYFLKVSFENFDDVYTIFIQFVYSFSHMALTFRGRGASRGNAFPKRAQILTKHLLMEHRQRHDRLKD